MCGYDRGIYKTNNELAHIYSYLAMYAADGCRCVKKPKRRSDSSNSDGDVVAGATNPS